MRKRGAKRIEVSLRFYRLRESRFIRFDAFRIKWGTVFIDIADYSPIARSKNAIKTLSNPRGKRVAPKISH